MDSKDPFVGSWKLNPGRSQFALSHQPTSATMRWERTGKGYVMTAEGITQDGKPVKERPRAFNLDEKEHPIQGEMDLVETAHHPDANTIHVRAKKVDQVVSEGSYIVSASGSSLIAAVSGTDAQQRRFFTVTIWDRQ